MKDPHRSSICLVEEDCLVGNLASLTPQSWTTSHTL
jgi:hypothetical protein